MVTERPSIDDVATARAGAVFIALVILSFDPWGWSVFGPVKHLVVSVGALVVFGVAARRRVLVHRSSVLGWAVFLGWSALVGRWAADPLAHWIGTPDRRLGWVTWLLFALVFVAGQQIRGRSRLVVARGTAVAAAGLGVFVTAEALGLTPVDLAARLGGPFGNAAYLGAAAVLLLPVSTAVAFADTDRVWAALGWCGVIGAAVGLAGSQSRAAWVALAVMALASAPRWAASARRRPQIVALAAASIIAVVAASGVGARLAAVFDDDDPGGAGRLDEWRVAARVVATHPGGVGFEGYRIVFPAHVDDHYVQQHGRSVVTDRAHNVLLDLAITTGWPGALAALAGGAALLSTVWRLRDDAVLVGIAVACGGYLTHHLLLFPLAELDAVFWLFCGVLVASAARSTHTVSSRALAVGAAAAAAFLLPFTLRDVGADRHVRAVFDDAPDAVVRADAAVVLRPDSFRYHLIAAQTASASGLHDGAEQRIAEALIRAPRDPALLQARAVLSENRARATGEGGHLDRAFTDWQVVVAADPKHPDNLLRLGVVAVAAGAIDVAEESWIRAEHLAPTSPVPAGNLSILYDQLDRTADAAAAAARAAAIDPTYVPGQPGP